MIADRPQDAPENLARLIDDQTPRDSVLSRVYKVLDAGGGRAAIVPLKRWLDVTEQAARLSLLEAENARCHNALCVLLDHLELGEAGVLAADIEWVTTLVDSFAAPVGPAEKSGETP